MKTHSILLVEDDELDVISFRRSLKQLGSDYELHTAYNGKEALNFLNSCEKSKLPGVILLDVNMPKMNGIEFLKILRSDEKLKHISVFIITTSTENSDRVITEELGISGYILKPLNYNDNSKRADSMESFVQFHLRKIFADREI